MLTVDQIKNISFRKANIGGYRPDEVDNFIDDVVDTVEEMKRERAELIVKLEKMGNIVEDFKIKEQSLSDAILEQKQREKLSRKESEEQADKVLAEAKAEADRIIADANNRIIREKEMINKIEQEAANMRKRLVEAYQRQIAAIEALPDQIDVDTIKEDLDIRYPTDSYSDPTNEISEEDDDAFTKIEEAVEAATADFLDTSDNNTDEDSSTIQIEKSVFERKFGKLKFGKNYDVKAE